MFMDFVAFLKRHFEFETSSKYCSINDWSNQSEPNSETTC